MKVNKEVSWSALEGMKELERHVERINSFQVSLPWSIHKGLLDSWLLSLGKDKRCLFFKKVPYITLKAAFKELKEDKRSPANRKVVRHNWSDLLYYVKYPIT